MKAELIDSMGSDLSVCNSARVSFDKQAEWDVLDGQKVLKFCDKKLIEYLANHDHFTPFTHCAITLRETVPIFVARQRFKHTVGFSYNEVSRRYVDTTPDFYKPKHWRKRAENKKQGSSEEVVKVKVKDYENAVKTCISLYEDLLSQGVCPEQARMILPQSMYTSYYVTGSLFAFARAYMLRSSPDAQAEIRELAEDWNKIISKIFPVSWKALTAIAKSQSKRTK
jgi:thymidylate synthase (FAD)